MSEKHVLDGVTAGEKYLLYKGRPIVRENNIIVYGCVEEGYLLQLVIMTTKTYKGSEVADKVLVQIITAEDKKVIKQDMKSGLYDAFDIGVIWLERAITQ